MARNNQKKSRSKQKIEALDKPEAAAKSKSSTAKVNAKVRKLSPFHILAVGIILAAVGVQWMLKSDKAPTETAASLNAEVAAVLDKLVCQHTRGYCNQATEFRDRTPYAKEAISEGTDLFRVPRKLQLWDLDALRHFKRNKDFLARFKKNANQRLEAGAFLALYLWERFVDKPNENDLFSSYFRILPSNLSFHPIMWSEEKLQTILPTISHGYAVANSYRQMVLLEYETFRGVYPNLPLEEYKRCRILVLTRTIGTGPIDKSLEAEAASFMKTFGVDLQLGYQAMPPLLDFFNHYANPNVKWKYDMDGQSFTAFTNRNVDSGDMLFVNYGKNSEARLWAKYGFQVGDGSMDTELSIAVNHHIRNIGIPIDNTPLSYHPDTEKLKLASYLQYDDGYQECVTDPNSAAYKLKKLKLQHLMRMADRPKRWIITVAPLNPGGYAPNDKRIGQPQKVDPANLPAVDSQYAMTTCRLIALTESDFEGEAVEVLQQHLESQESGILIQAQSNSLEYLALNCIARLMRITSDEMKAKNATSDELKEEEGISAAQQVFQGELLSLKMTSKLAKESLQQLKELMPDLPIRDTPCNWKHTEKLAHDTKNV
jgi:hypothetical protein